MRLHAYSMGKNKKTTICPCNIRAIAMASPKPPIWNSNCLCCRHRPPPPCHFTEYLLYFAVCRLSVGLWPPPSECLHFCSCLKVPFDCAVSHQCFHFSGLYPNFWYIFCLFCVIFPCVLDASVYSPIVCLQLLFSVHNICCTANSFYSLQRHFFDVSRLNSIYREVHKLVVITSWDRILPKSETTCNSQHWLYIGQTLKSDREKRMSLTAFAQQSEYFYLHRASVSVCSIQFTLAT